MQKEQLSAYIDGEQVNVELTTALCKDEELQQSWVRFHTIRAVMRKESAVFLDTDFTQKMADLIENEEMAEPVIQISQPTPKEVETLPFMQKFKALWQPMAQLAVAAGVCLVAVLGIQSFNTKTEVNGGPESPVLQTLPFNTSVQEVSYNAPSKDVATSEQIEQKSRRIGAMLQNYELQRRLHSDSLNVGQNQK